MIDCQYIDVEDKSCYPSVARVGASTIKKKEKKDLNPDTQQAILEIATVRRLQNQVDHENAFTMRYQKIFLHLEDAE
jgi:hypothetical protein